MPKGYEERRVRADEIGNDRPLNDVFTDSMIHYLEDPSFAEIRDVVARNVRVPEGFEATPEGLGAMRTSFEEGRLRSEEMMIPICVLERLDGSLWAYDDAHLITLYHALAPARRVRCAIIGSDPA